MTTCRASQTSNDPHMAPVLLKFITIMEGLTIIPHLHNFPNLSPCDFWLFDLIKENLIDQSNLESLYVAVSDFVYF